MTKTLDKLKKKYSEDLIYVYHNNKQILKGNNLKEIKKNIKENVKNPSKDIKLYLITFSYMNKPKNIFMINCVQKTITSDSELISREMDLGQSIFYSKDDLDKIGFKKSHLEIIIKLIKTGDMPYDKDMISISKIISLSKKL
jgi:hypothetical protein